jgi:LacI family transcriptional regulator
MDTIEQIASEVGVSVTTVRRVLRGGNKETWPSAVRRARMIRDAAERLGYKANWCAASLARKSTRTIALVHHMVVPVPTDQWLHIMEETVEVLHQAGYDLQFVAGGSARTPQMLMEQRFDACIVVHRLLPEIARAVEQADLPMVQLNCCESAMHPSIINDDVASGRTLTEHLINLGHKRIAYYHRSPEGQGHVSVQTRLDGVTQAMQQAGLPVGPVAFYEDAQTCLDQVMQMNDRPTAVVTYDDYDALPLQHACWQSGVKVPDELSIATFNDTRQARYATPPLTTMDVPAADAARAAVNVLLQWLAGDEQVQQLPQQLLPAKLIIRQSTGTAPSC